ncbi:hypothetical protein BGZ70_003912 [Mortierella alpina]|uniref:Uncharacterized protein n=1 Tax=Mortierella alpina TaxID=64518 RepID=A0A9P6JA28_MORAP|nr:hypothetical protein BGZ70_003912 [Mortierella alpina]
MPPAPVPYGSQTFGQGQQLNEGPGQHPGYSQQQHHQQPSYQQQPQQSQQGYQQHQQPAPVAPPQPMSQSQQFRPQIPTQPVSRPRIDPDQIPSPVAVQEADQQEWDDKSFITSLKTSTAPLASSDFHAIDGGNISKRARSSEKQHAVRNDRLTMLIMLT